MFLICCSHVKFLKMHLLWFQIWVHLKKSVKHVIIQICVDTAQIVMVIHLMADVGMALVNLIQFG